MTIKSTIGEFNNLEEYIAALKSAICNDFCKYHDLPESDPQSYMATGECKLSEIM